MLRKRQRMQVDEERATTPTPVPPDAKLCTAQPGRQSGRLKPIARASNPRRTLEGVWTPRRLAAVKEAAASHEHP